MRLLAPALLLGAALGNDKPDKNSVDPRLKMKPHKWKTSMDDLAAVKDAAPKEGSWAEPIFSKSDATAPVSPVAAKALEAREKAKVREQKTTSTTAKPAAKPVKKAPVAKTTTTTTTTSKAHKYWKPVNATSDPVTVTKPVPAVNFHNTSGLKVAVGRLNVASAAPSGPAAAMMKGPAPAPAPAPAPLTYEQQVAKLKGDMMAKIKGDSFDADLIIHRPTKVPPGPESAGKENPVGEFKDVGSDFGPYAGQPGFAPAAAPLKHDDISFKTGSLPVDAAHKNRETMTSDFGMEYGPNGPQGIHGARPQAGNFKPLEIR